MITPSDEQHRAIKAIINWYENEPAQQEFFLDGEAGTGKTTTVQIAIQELRSRHSSLHISQAAYTAKAALVMRQKGAPSASTIHRMIYKAYHDKDDKLYWVLWENGPASRTDLIVIDEVSLVSRQVADDLRSFGAKILVLGDVGGQLPPIGGEGAFTDREPDFRLLELNRFAMEDPINALAQRARRGSKLYPAFSEGNVKLIYMTPESSREAFTRPDTQIICGRHKVRWSITRNARARLGYHDPLPRVGEPLICCQNNYGLGILNGEFLEAIQVVDSDELNISWNEPFDDPEPENQTGSGLTPVRRQLFDAHYTERKPLEPPYNPNFAILDWAYAITCHKAQGSEWPHVTIVDDSMSFKWEADLPRRWLYTAISRASEGLILLLRK